MKKQLTNIFAILFCIFTFAAAGKAQLTNSLKIEIPFDFIVKKRVFPAGKYYVERLDRANPRVLILRENSGKIKLILQPQETLGDKFSEESKLIFSRSNGAYFLTGIWQSGEKNGYRVLSGAPQ